MDKVELVMDRTLAGLKAKVNKLFEQGYYPEGSYNKTKDGRWFMQSMVLVPTYGTDTPLIEKYNKEPKPNRAKKAPEKRSHHKKA